MILEANPQLIVTKIINLNGEQFFEYSQKHFFYSNFYDINLPNGKSFAEIPVLTNIISILAMQL
jgi:hypothetical protein